MKDIFFDLDGTLTDSGEGIINCATLALEHFGLPVPTREEMGVFVGPPLDQTFLQHGVPEDRIQEAIQVFRSRYLTVGKFENYPYPGIPELLQALRSSGCRLYVATSKPESTALEVLTHFDLTQYFEKICGATMDSSRITKEQVLTYLLTQLKNPSNAVMVGDTTFDVIGATAHGIPTIGVAWGYGKAKDLLDAGAVSVAKTPAALLDLLTTF